MYTIDLKGMKLLQNYSTESLRGKVEMPTAQWHPGSSLCILENCTHVNIACQKESEVGNLTAKGRSKTNQPKHWEPQASS